MSTAEPVQDGTFRSCVAGLTLFHPITASDACRKTERVDHLRGVRTHGIVVARPTDRAARRKPVSVKRHAIGTCPGGARGADLAGKSLFAYTWHDATPRRWTFGRGYVYEGTLDPGGLDARDLAVPYRVLTAAGRARLPFSLWNAASARVFASAYWHRERHRPEVTTGSLFDAIFPFARRSAFFRLFGRPAVDTRSSPLRSDRTPSWPS
jgi:hypothetical protein